MISKTCPDASRAEQMEAFSLSKHPHSVWLRPESHVAESLRADIRTLCSLYDGPAFEPHVTLVGDVIGDAHKTLTECTRVFSGSKAIPATITGVVSTEAYFMSLFLELDVPSDLISVRQKAIKQLDLPPPAPFRPHISMAYGFNQQDASAHHIEKLKAKYVGSTLVLTSLAIVASSTETPIENWEISSEFSFE